MTGMNRTRPEVLPAPHTACHLYAPSFTCLPLGFPAFLYLVQVVDNVVFVSCWFGFLMFVRTRHTYVHFAWLNSYGYLFMYSLFSRGKVKVSICKSVMGMSDAAKGQRWWRGSMSLACGMYGVRLTLPVLHSLVHSYQCKGKIRTTYIHTYT